MEDPKQDVGYQKVPQLNSLFLYDANANVLLCDEDFTLRDDDTFSGLTPTIHKVSDREINGVIERYKKLNPADKRTEEELRPYAVNTILGWQRK